MIFDRRLIRFKHLFAVGKTAYQHQKRAFRQMKIGQKHIHCPRFVRRIQKYIGRSALSMNSAVFSGTAFQRAYGSCAYCYDPFASGTRGIDQIGGPLNIVR